MNGPQLPKALRDAVLEAAARPVRPLAHPLQRAALAFALGLGVVLLGVAVFGLRANAPMLGAAAVHGPALLRVLAAGLFLVLAMREGVPGEGASASTRRMLLLLVPLLLALLAEWLARAARNESGDLGPLRCYYRSIVLALPLLGLVAWLLARAYPLQPVFAATSGALAAALFSDAALHLICPVTGRAHTLVVHGGAVVTLAAAGALAGWLRLKRRASRIL